MHKEPLNPTRWVHHDSLGGHFACAVNDNAMKLGAAGFSRPLFNGFKSAGEGEDFRVVSWTNPEHPTQHHVGFLFERWPAGTLTRMNAVPYTQLWTYQNHATREEADAARVSLTLNNVFSTIMEKAKALPDERKFVRTDAQYLPFAKPPHWHPDTGPRPSVV